LSEKNKHGLSRYIPENIKSEIRKRCGFGCLLCGKVPYDYDHLDVEFKDADEHNPDDIVLLCQNHHRRKHNGFLAPETIKRILHSGRRRNANYFAEFLNPNFRVSWPHGVVLPPLSPCGIKFNGKDVFEISRTKDEFDPIKISCSFNDSSGNIACVVKENEFVFVSDAIEDFTCKKNVFRLTKKAGKVLFEITLSNLSLRINKMDIAQDGCFLVVGKKYLGIGNAETSMSFKGCFITGGAPGSGGISVYRSERDMKFNKAGKVIVPPGPTYEDVGFAIEGGLGCLTVGRKRRAFLTNPYC